MPHDWYPPFEPPWGVVSSKPLGRFDMSAKMDKLEAWNREEKVYLDKTGSHRNLYVYGPNADIVPMYPSCDQCWREKDDGTREPVTYYDGYGWAGPEDFEKFGDLIRLYG